MALSPRRRGRRRPRWLLVGVVATAVVLIVNGAFSSSESPSFRLAQLAYLDEVRPEVDRSTAQGAAIDEIRGEALTLGSQGVSRRLARVSREAEAVLAAVQDADPPEVLETSHTMLVATVAIRARVAAAVEEGMRLAFSDGPPEPAVDALAADPGLWAPPEMAAFVASIRSSTTRTPVHDVGVLAVTTDPVAVATEGNATVLPLVRTLRLDVVVANTGNSAEKGVPVVATLIGPAGEVDTARDFVDLEPGQRRSVPLGGLRPVPGGPSTLTVIVGPVEGESSIPDNERSVGLVMRG